MEHLKFLQTSTFKIVSQVDGVLKLHEFVWKIPIEMYVMPTEIQKISNTQLYLRGVEKVPLFIDWTSLN